jgi:flavin-binding protein dodecin
VSAIYKHVTLTGEGASIEDAIGKALEVSGEAVSGHSWLEVEDIRASLGANAAVEAYQVTIKVAFEVDRSKMKSD